MIDDKRRRTEIVLPPLPAPLHLVAAVLAWDALTPGDRWSILRLGNALRGRTTPPPQETVRQWLERHGQTPNLCRLLWEPLALAALNQPIDRAAATAFVAVVSRMFGSQPDAATLLLPAVPLDELYTIPSQQFLARSGGRVTTHAKAQIVTERDRVVGVHLRGTMTVAPFVICAVPWFDLATVFVSPPAALAPMITNASAMASAPIVTVNLWLDGYETDDGMLGLPGRMFQWVFARRVLLGRDQSHLSLVSSGADAICRAANRELVQMALAELCDAIPRVRDAHLRHASVVRERRATFSLEPSGPARPETVTPISGLLLAGDWIDTGLPATIESAVTSGHAAARAALHLLRPHERAKRASHTSERSERVPQVSGANESYE
jgi:squalene-associated FAD-dependent desaturase